MLTSPKNLSNYLHLSILDSQPPKNHVYKRILESKSNPIEKLSTNHWTNWIGAKKSKIVWMNKWLWSKRLNRSFKLEMTKTCLILLLMSKKCNTIINKWCQDLLSTRKSKIDLVFFLLISFEICISVININIIFVKMYTKW